MKLGDWRRSAGLTQQQLADELGCVLVTVARYEAGMRRPDDATMIALYVRSGGRVQPNDFYDLPPLTAASAAA